MLATGTLVTVGGATGVAIGVPGSEAAGAGPLVAGADGWAVGICTCGVVVGAGRHAERGHER